MEIHQLRYFCAVAREGGFTRAAQSQNVSQPSLSQQLQKLEEELGAPLFDRLPRGARLTRFGRAFLPRAEQILRELEEAKTEVEELAGREKGELVIGVIPTVAPYFLPGLLSGFAREHHSVSVRVVEDITPALLEKLEHGDLDVVVAALPAPKGNFRVVELFCEPVLAALPASHRLANRQSLRLEELSEEPFLLLKEGHCFRQTVISACAKARLDPQVVFESGQFATLLGLVAAGMGVSAVPAMAAQPTGGCRFVRIEDEHSVRRIGAILHRKRFMARCLRAFLRYLRQSCKEGGMGVSSGSRTVSRPSRP